MATPGLYKSAQASLFNICKNFATEMQSASVATLKVFNFDSAADANEWPEGDLVGLAEFQVNNSVGILEAMVLFAVSTENDPSLDRLDTLTSRLFDKFDIGAGFTFLDDKTGAPLGRLVVKDGVRVMPVARTRTRPVKFIGVEFGSDRAF